MSLFGKPKVKAPPPPPLEGGDAPEIANAASDETEAADRKAKADGMAKFRINRTAVSSGIAKGDAGLRIGS